MSKVRTTVTLDPKVVAILDKLAAKWFLNTSAAITRCILEANGVVNPQTKPRSNAKPAPNPRTFKHPHVPSQFNPDTDQWQTRADAWALDYPFDGVYSPWHGEPVPCEGDEPTDEESRAYTQERREYVWRVLEGREAWPIWPLRDPDDGQFHFEDEEAYRSTTGEDDV